MRMRSWEIVPVFNTFPHENLSKSTQITILYLMLFHTRQIYIISSPPANMNDQSDSLASTSATFPQPQQSKDKLTIRKHNIDPDKNYLRINKQQLDFSRLSKEIKLSFQNSSLQNIFKGWQAKVDHGCVAKSIGITDTDAIPLILKMLRVIDSQKLTKNKECLERDLSILDKKLSDLSFLHRQINIKKKKLQKQSILKGDTLAALQLYEKMTAQEIQVSTHIHQLQKSKQSISIRLQNIKEQSNPSFSSLLTIAMNKNISKMSRNLIKESILFIIEGQSIPFTNFCESFVVFQQAYHTIRMNRQEVVRLIGSQAYLQKVKLSTQLMKQSESSENVAILACHSCMNLFPSSSLKHCSNKISQKETKSYISSDFIMYRNNVIHSDFFAQTDQHVLSYFTYNKDFNDELCCNRSYCLPCLQDIYKIQHNHRFKCPFCCGNCNCRRCQAAVALVKCIAYDVDQDPQLKSKYHQILNLISTNNPFHRLPLRNINDTSQFSLLASHSSNKSDQISYQVLTNHTLKEEEVLIEEEEDRTNKIADPKYQQFESLFLSFSVENAQDLHFALQN